MRIVKAFFDDAKASLFSCNMHVQTFPLAPTALVHPFESVQHAEIIKILTLAKVALNV